MQKKKINYYNLIRLTLILFFISIIFLLSNISNINSVSAYTGTTTDGILYYNYSSETSSYTVSDCVESATTITIPSTYNDGTNGEKSVTSIGTSAFFGSTSLTSITIPNSVTSIGIDAFYGCTSLISITIPSSVISIRDGSFQNCTSFTSVIIPSSVTSIGDWAFGDCTSLTSIIIPSSVTNIGSCAFYGCSKLTTMVMKGTSVPTLFATSSISSATTAIYVPSSSLSAYQQASNWSTFANIIVDYGEILAFSDFTYTIINSISDTEKNICINSVNSALTFYTIDSIYYSEGITYHIKQIGNGSCIDFDVVNITLFDGIITIASYAFYDCKSLTSITIPNTVTTIGSSFAFYSCSNLTSITIPKNITSIGFNSFAYCTSLASINVDSNNSYFSSLNGVLFNKDQTTIVAYPNAKGSSYTIPDSVTAIGISAFEGCSSLASITIPTSVKQICNWAFGRCSNLVSVTIPSSVTSIETYAFLNCSSLTSITIPSSVTSIETYAFGWCSSLTSITIPSSVTSIETYAFGWCSSLNNIQTDSTSKATDGTNGAYVIDSNGNAVTTGGIAVVVVSSGSIHTLNFAGETITNLTIPSSVTSIGTDAFIDCISLTSITIPSSVTGIGSYAFQGCTSLTSITIPSSITGIGSFAFLYCSKLTTMVMKGTSVPSLESITSISSATTAIYVPSSSLSAYQQASNWSTYANKMIGYGGGDVLVFGDFNYTIINSISDTEKNICIDSVTSALTSYAIDSTYYSEGITYHVKQIGNGSCIDTDAVSVTLFDGITSIGTYAFFYCSSLTSITIPSSVTSIGDLAFRGCISLTSITIPSSVTSIGTYAFYNCSSLTSITIPSSITNIGDSTFRYCSSLTSITIPSNVTSLKIMLFLIVQV